MSETNTWPANETDERGEHVAPAEAPRRLNAATVLQMLHDERMAQATKPSREDRPRITLKRSTASGSLGVVGIDVDVPVCEEFPSSAEAQAEAMRLMDELAARYPMPDRNGAK
jgi:hypothetical protein